MPSSKGPTDNRRSAAKEHLAQKLRDGDNESFVAAIREANSAPAEGPWYVAPDGNIPSQYAPHVTCPHGAEWDGRTWTKVQPAAPADGLREAAIAVLDSWERGDIDNDYDRFASTYDALRAALKEPTDE